MFTQEQIQIANNFTDAQRRHYNALRASGMSPEISFTATVNAFVDTDEPTEKGVVGQVAEFAGDVAREAAGALLVRPAARATEAVTRLVAPDSLAAEGYRQMADSGESQAFAGVEVSPVSSWGQGAGTQITGEALESASYLPFARAATATRGALLNRTVTPLIREGAIGAGLYSAGTQLQDTGTINPLALGRDTAVGGILGGVLGVGAAGAGIAGRTAVQAGRRLGGAAQDVSTRTTSSLSELLQRARESRFGEGLQQVGAELVERVPRTGRRISEGLEEAAERAERIRTSSPAVGEAVRNFVDDGTITRITSTDQPTLKVLDEVIDIAENPTRASQNALTPIGEEAVTAYNLIDAERKAVGQRLNEAVSKLSKNDTVNADIDRKLQEIFNQNDITLTFDNRNPLQFGSGYTEPQRNALIKLYNEITRFGNELTPRDIYNMDRTLSTMRRESRVIDGVENLYLTIGEGADARQVDAFTALRNIFSEALDELDPSIRALNREYAPLRALQDDLDVTLFRDTMGLESLNFSDLVGREGFFPNAIRRVFSNAQSQANYQGMLKLLQQEADKLGYKGANLEQAGDIAIELLDNYFPAGLQRTSLRRQVDVSRPTPSNIIGNILGAGRVNQEDQRRAIRGLITELLESTD